MTGLDWVCFIAFTISINVICQIAAWKIANYMLRKEENKKGVKK